MSPEDSSFDPSPSPLAPLHSDAARTQTSAAGWQRALLRRLMALLCTGTVAFTLTTWLLVRHPTPAGVTMRAARPVPADAGEPERLARAQLDALGHGDARTAYDLFSPHYREGVTFDTFRQLLNSHRELFRAQEQEMETRAATEDRVDIDVHLLAGNGEEYVASFAIVRLSGRWWIDDLHWTADDGRDDLTTA